MTFGEILSRQRKAHGWSQERLAEHLGITRQSLIALEHDRRTPSLALAMAVAHLFDTSLDALVKPLEREPAAMGSTRWLGPQPLFPTPVIWAFVAHTVVLVPTDRLLRPRLPDALWDPRSGRLTTMPSGRDPRHVILMGGCDPFASWLQTFYETERPGYWLEPVRLSSESAIHAFNEGLLHVAGAHLFDPTTQRYNRISFAGNAVFRQPYLQWEEGLICHPEASHIKHIAIREPGSEAHNLYRRHQGSGPWQPDVFYSHQSILDYVISHPQWAGVGLGSLAATAGLCFEPWALESYDLFLREADRTAPWAARLFTILASGELRSVFAAMPHITLSLKAPGTGRAF